MGMRPEQTAWAGREGAASWLSVAGVPVGRRPGALESRLQHEVAGQLGCITEPCLVLLVILSGIAQDLRGRPCATWAP